VTDVNTTAALSGWRNQGTATASTVNIFADVAGGPPSDGSLPEGASYASIAVGTNGTAVVTGKAADGSAIASSGYFGPSGQVFVYSAFYTLPGSLMGVVNVDKTDAVVQRATGSLTWSHPQQTSGRTFAKGWSPITLTVDGGKYYPATPSSATFLDGTNIPMNLPDNSSFTDKTNAQITFSGANVPGTPTLSGLQLLPPPGLPVLPTGSANPASTTLSLINGTGSFSGTFTLSDGRGKITYQGLIVPVVSTVSKKLDGVGYGYFTLPQAASATSLIYSGLVILEAKR